MGEPPVVGSLKVSTYGRCLVIEGVHWRNVSGYWRFPLTERVWSLKVSTYGRYLVIEGVHLREVSGYCRCPLTRGIWLLKVSTERWCRIIEGVHLREVSGYWRCPLTDGVVRCCCTNAWLIRSLEKAGFEVESFVLPCCCAHAWLIRSLYVSLLPHWNSVLEWYCIEEPHIEPYLLHLV